MLTLFFLFVLGLLFTGSPRLQYTLSTDGSYMAPERTRMINGIFMVLMILRHTTLFGVPAQPEDAMYCHYIDAPLLQCIVCIYFFFSGYGIMFSLQSKGREYLHSLLSKRFLSLYKRFIAAAAIAYLLYFCINGDWQTQSAKFLQTIILFKGWWFIRVSLYLYVLTWFSFRCCGFSPASSGRTYAAIALLTLSITIMVSMISPFYESWSLDTEWCFPAGMLYFMLRSRAERLINATRLPAMLWGAVLTLAALWVLNHYSLFLRSCEWVLGYPLRGVAILHLHYTSALACIFSIGITWFFAGITWQKVPGPLVWLGENAFYLFLFQYVSIRFFKAVGLNTFSPELGILCTFIGAVVLSALMKKLLTRINL